MQGGYRISNTLKSDLEGIRAILTVMKDITMDKHILSKIKAINAILNKYLGR